MKLARHQSSPKAHVEDEAQHHKNHHNSSDGEKRNQSL